MSHYFRPCIDLHQGKVSQIVGSTFSHKNGPKVNFSTQISAEHYAKNYKKDKLENGHIILLGKGNEDAALRALKIWPGSFHIGGGMDIKKAAYFLKQGAKKIIFTSWVIQSNKIYWDRLKELVLEFGKEKIALDISCQEFGKDYYIMTDKWKNQSQHRLIEVIDALIEYSSDFLVHSTTVEGKKQGIDKVLVELLRRWSQKTSITYAGGITSYEDINYIINNGKSPLYFSIGSALDIFGGNLSYQEIVSKFKKR